MVGWLVSNQFCSKTALTIFLIFCMKVHHYKGKKLTRRFFRKKSQFFFISNFVSKIEVFAHFLKNGSNDLAETSYLDSLDHYLQLSNWSYVQENLSLPFFFPKWSFFGHFWRFDWVKISPRKILSDFLDFWHEVRGG